MVSDNIVPETIREKMEKEAKRIENDTFFQR